MSATKGVKTGVGKSLPWSSPEKVPVEEFGGIEEKVLGTFPQEIYPWCFFLSRQKGIYLYECCFHSSTIKLLRLWSKITVHRRGAYVK